MYDVMTSFVPYAPGSFDTSSDPVEDIAEALTAYPEADVPEAYASALSEFTPSLDEVLAQQDRKLVADLNRSGSFNVPAQVFAAADTLARISPPQDQYR